MRVQIRRSDRAVVPDGDFASVAGIASIATERAVATKQILASGIGVERSAGVDGETAVAAAATDRLRQNADRSDTKRPDDVIAGRGPLVGRDVDLARAVAVAPTTANAV